MKIKKTNICLPKKIKAQETNKFQSAVSSFNMAVRRILYMVKKAVFRDYSCANFISVASRGDFIFCCQFFSYLSYRGKILKIIESRPNFTTVSITRTYISHQWIFITKFCDTFIWIYCKTVLKVRCKLNLKQNKLMWSQIH